MDIVEVAEASAIRTKQLPWDYEHLEPTFHGAFYKYTPGKTEVMDRDNSHEFLCFLKVAVAKVYQQQTAPAHAV